MGTNRGVLDVHEVVWLGYIGLQVSAGIFVYPLPIPLPPFLPSRKIVCPRFQNLVLAWFVSTVIFSDLVR